jgi:hypothetical protein
MIRTWLFGLRELLCLLDGRYAFSFLALLVKLTGARQRGTCVGESGPRSRLFGIPSCAAVG